MVVQQKPTEQMIADFFTKPLAGERFIMLRNIIMGQDTDEDVFVMGAEEHKEYRE